MQSFTVGYSYDSSERMTALTYPDGHSVAYRYSERGLLRAIDGFVDGIVHNALGQVTGVTYANGVEEHHSFDDHTFFLNETIISGPTRAEAYYHMPTLTMPSATP
jgi:YD repeat-containing protein